MNPSVIIYRDRLLGPSETFIKEQAESLRRFTPYYLGARPIGGLSLPLERTMFIGERGPLGRIKEIASKGFHFAPSTIRKAKALSPALIHAHFALDAVDAMPIAAKLNIPLITTFHGFDVTTNDEFMRLQRRGRRYLRKRRDLTVEGARFIAVSEFISSRAFKVGFPADRTQVHYIGVDLDRFQPDPSVTRKPIILFVGRLVEKKGCEYVIRAAASLQREMNGITLTIIGDGPLRDTLEQLSRVERCKCQFLGIRSQAVIRDWMNRAKVFCTPSVTAKNGDSEGFGIVFVEAQAMELPVASFASGGIPEAVEHGVTGLLAAERDWVALARHLKTLLTDDSIWLKFSLAGRERVGREFNIKRQTDLLENIYEDVIREWRTSKNR